MEKVYGPLKKDKRAFFRAYVELINPFIKIRSREADVFAELLYQHYLKKDDIKSKEDRFKLILGHDSRRNMEDYLNISEAVFRNALSGLRQKGLLLDDNTIADGYLLSPTEENFRLVFNFKIEN